jgi:hypothetical protein
MLSFAQFYHFLTEKFLSGFDANHGYAEIYKNPTPNEWTLVGNKRMPPWDLEKFGKPCYYAGGILTDKDFYVFDRENAEHFATAREIPKLPTWFPLYCYYFAGTGVLALSASSYSFNKHDNDKYYKSRADDPSRRLILAKIKGHPQIKKYSKVVDLEGKPFPV